MRALCRLQLRNSSSQKIALPRRHIAGDVVELRLERVVEGLPRPPEEADSQFPSRLRLRIEIGLPDSEESEKVTWKARCGAFADADDPDLRAAHHADCHRGELQLQRDRRDEPRASGTDDEDVLNHGGTAATVNDSQIGCDTIPRQHPARQGVSRYQAELFDSPCKPDQRPSGIRVGCERCGSLFLACPSRRTAGPTRATSRLRRCFSRARGARSSCGEPRVS